MLERPSNISERVQKWYYKTFKWFITCYNGLYDNVIRCANRSNILFLTCCVTCCMTCLNGFPGLVCPLNNSLCYYTENDVSTKVRGRRYD